MTPFFFSFFSRTFHLRTYTSFFRSHDCHHKSVGGVVGYVGTYLRLLVHYIIISLLLLLLVSISKPDEKGMSKKFPDKNPLNLTSCRGMSLILKMTGKGVSAKVNELFCHCCDTTLDKITHHNTTYCDFCTDFVEDNDDWRQNWRCYHKQITASSHKDEITKEYG